MPLRRVNQAYVIATTTKLDVSGVKLPATVTDAFFAAKAERKPTKKSDFFALQAAADDKSTSAERKATQAAVDAAIKTTAEIKAYLKSTFSLRKGDKPHEMAW